MRLFSGKEVALKSPDKMNELAEFTKKWCLDDRPPSPVDRDQLDEAERQLMLNFPMDYRFQVLKFGLPSPTLALLSAIIDQGLDIYDLSDLYQPTDIVTSTRNWRNIGMPELLVAIGGDSSGNHFCFDERDLRNGKMPRAAVYHWDHDFNVTEKLAPSFSAWIASYLASWSDGIKPTDF